MAFPDVSTAKYTASGIHLSQLSDFFLIITTIVVII